MCHLVMDEVSGKTQLRKLPRLQPRGGIRVMYAAISALLLRELQTRFGQYRLGYLWIFLEPLFSIGVLVVLFGTIMTRTLPGMDYTVFLINGIIPFFMFRTGISQAMSAVQSNKGLFSYKPVKPIDALLARNFLELVLKVIVYIAFSAALIWFGFHISFSYIPELIFYWILLFLFMVSCSLVFMVLADFSNELEKFVSVFFLLLYLLSGIVYSIHIIPTQYREYLLWNPLIHIIEHMRHAVAPSYALVPGISLNYFLIWLMCATFIGLLLYKRFEKRMVMSR
jgi:capsular polysaccharide transport system permease protein